MADVSEKTKDKLVSYGEIISTNIIFEYLKKKYNHINSILNIWKLFSPS